MNKNNNNCHLPGCACTKGMKKAVSEAGDAVRAERVQTIVTGVLMRSLQPPVDDDGALVFVCGVDERYPKIGAQMHLSTAMLNLVVEALASGQTWVDRYTYDTNAKVLKKYINAFMMPPMRAAEKIDITMPLAGMRSTVILRDNMQQDGARLMVPIQLAPLAAHIDEAICFKGQYYWDAFSPAERKYYIETAAVAFTGTSDYQTILHAINSDTMMLLLLGSRSVHHEAERGLSESGAVYFMDEVARSIHAALVSANANLVGFDVRFGDLLKRPLLCESVILECFYLFYMGLLYSKPFTSVKPTADQIYLGIPPDLKHRFARDPEMKTADKGFGVIPCDNRHLCAFILAALQPQMRPDRLFASLARPGGPAIVFDVTEPGIALFGDNSETTLARIDQFYDLMVLAKDDEVLCEETKQIARDALGYTWEDSWSFAVTFRCLMLQVAFDTTVRRFAPTDTPFETIRQGGDLELVVACYVEHQARIDKAMARFVAATVAARARLVDLLANDQSLAGTHRGQRGGARRKRKAARRDKRGKAPVPTPPTPSPDSDTDAGGDEGEEAEPAPVEPTPAEGSDDSDYHEMDDEQAAFVSPPKMADADDHDDDDPPSMAAVPNKYTRYRAPGEPCRMWPYVSPIKGAADPYMPVARPIGYAVQTAFGRMVFGPVSPINGVE